MEDSKIIVLKHVSVIFSELEDKGFGRNIVINATDPKVQKAIVDWVKLNNINVNEAYDKLQEENKGGQIATVALDGTESMGTDPKLSLPSVSNKIESEEGKLPSSKVDKKKVQKSKQEHKSKAKKDKAHANKTKTKLSEKEIAAKELAENYQKSQKAVD